MTETIPSQLDFPETIHLLKKLVINRDDAFAEQQPDGQYYCKKEGLSNLVLEDHLKGTRTIGVYSINPEKQDVKTIGFDIDGDPRDLGPTKAASNVIHQALLDSGVPQNSILVEFTGLKGFRATVFLDPPISAAMVRNFALKVTGDIKIPDGASLEIFPKQDRVEKGHFGNLVKLFFALHRKSGKRAHLVNPVSFDPWPWEALKAIKPWRMPLELRVHDTTARKEISKPPLSAEDNPCWRKISVGDIPVGSRHDAAFAYARHLRDQKLGKEAVLSVMEKWWGRLAQPPQVAEARPWKNIKNAVEDAYDKKYSVGCATIRGRWPDLCDPDCPIRKREETCQNFQSGNVKIQIEHGICTTEFNDAPKVRLVIKRVGERWRYHIVVIGEGGVEPGITHMSGSPPWEENRTIWKKVEEELAEAGKENPHNALVAVGKLLFKNGGEVLFKEKKTGDESKAIALEVKESAEEWTKDPGLLYRLDRVIHEEKELVGETKNASLTFFSMNSAKSHEPVNLRWSGRAAVGKSTIVTRVADLFPPEMVIIRMGLTKKSIFYLPEAEEVNELTRKVSLDGKILVILEEENSQEFLDEIKPLLSHDMRRLSYSFVEEKQTKTVHLEGWPAYIGITTQSKRDETTDSRTLLGSPDMGKAKYGAVISRDADRKSRPWEYRKGENVEVMRQVIRALPRKKVWNPFANVVERHFPHTKARMMRDFLKLMGLIDSITLFHQHQRPRVTINGEEHVVTLPIDIRIAFRCAESSLSETLHGLEADVQRFYNFLVETDDSLEDDDRPAKWTYKDLQRLYKEHFGEGVGRTTLRTRYIEKLEDLGMMDVDDSKKPFVHSICSSELAPLTDSTKILSEVESEETKQDLIEKTLASAGGCVDVLYVPGKSGDALTLEDVIHSLYAHPPDANVEEVLGRSFEQDYAVSDLNHDSVNHANLVREKKLKKGILNFLTKERARLNEGERESTWSKKQLLLTLEHLVGEEVAWEAVEDVSNNLDWVEVVEVPDKGTTYLSIHWGGVETRKKEGAKPENGGAKKKRELSQADLMDQLGELHKRTGGEGLTVEGFATMAVANLRNECEGRLREAVHQMAEHGVPFKTLGGAQVEAEKKEEKLPPSSTGALPPIQEIVKVFEPLKGGGKISREILTNSLGVTREGLKKILVMPQVSGLIIDRGSIVEGK